MKKVRVTTETTLHNAAFDFTVNYDASRFIRSWKYNIPHFLGTQITSSGLRFLLNKTAALGLLNGRKRRKKGETIMKVAVPYLVRHGDF